MEIWDLYDENRNKLGKTHVRGERLPDGCYHLCVHIWIRNSEGKYLISQRSADRTSFPLFWECSGGSVCAGEDSLEGALREAYEELGVALDPEKGSVVYSRVRKDVGGKRFNDIMDVWLFHYDGEADLSAATTPDEVAAVSWATGEEIRTLFDAGELVPTLGYFFELDCF